MKIDLQVEVEHKDGKYPSFNLILRTGPGKDPFMIVRGCRIVNGANGDFISYPSRKQDDGKYWNHVYGSKEFNDIVMSAANHATAKPKAAAPSKSVEDIPDDLPW
jgi:DNA-binding cell septation regulator SpoVG